MKKKENGKLWRGPPTLPEIFFGPIALFALFCANLPPIFVPPVKSGGFEKKKKKKTCGEAPRPSPKKTPSKKISARIMPEFRPDFEFTNFSGATEEQDLSTNSAIVPNNVKASEQVEGVEDKVLREALADLEKKVLTKSIKTMI